VPRELAFNLLAEERAASGTSRGRVFVAARPAGRRTPQRGFRVIDPANHRRPQYDPYDPYDPSAPADAPDRSGPNAPADPTDPYAAYDDHDDLTRGGRRQRSRAPRHRRADSAVVVEPAEADDGNAYAFPITYRASRHEARWLFAALRRFVDQGDVVDVLRQIKGGKEATVYLCAAGPSLGAPLVAAKVYRPQAFRALRNDALYRQGREVLGADGKAMRDERAMHAIRKGTARGKELGHASWMAHEVGALQRLHAAGLPVPEPLGMGSNVVLMAYVGDREGAAPTLARADLARSEAAGVLDALLEAVGRMLALGLVHGDLSAYNVLWWEGRPTIIDFPQIVDVRSNPAARELLGRDVARLCTHFARQGAARDAGAVAEALWREHVPHDLWLEHSAEFVAAREADEDDREGPRSARGRR